jgi:plastocyanin
LKRTTLILFALAATLVLVHAAVAQKQDSETVTTIKLVQTPGQFEPQKLELKAGKYIFAITNKGIHHEVGFYLRKKTADGKGKPLANSDAGHLKDGETGKSGVVTLEPGEYLYSCPLNPTPHYIITVK